MKILFTGVGRRIELLQAFRNAALVLDKELKIYGADIAGNAPALAYCDFTRKVVAMKSPDYIGNLLDICRKDDIDLIIPTIDTDLMVLSENRNKFADIGTEVLISAPDKIRICRDKNETSQFFVDCGLHAPMPVNDIHKYSSGFPAFIKPKDGSSSVNSFRADNKEELEVYASQIEDYIIQPFVSGREYTVDIFCDLDGEPVSIIPRERIQVRAGEVLKTRIRMDSGIISEMKNLCRAFHPRGPITVQLIKDSEGINWYIEINPRFGGGAPLSMKAGARSAETILKLISGEEITRSAVIKDGAVYSRFDQSVCITEGKGRVRGVIFDLDDTLFNEKDYVKSGYRAVSDYLGGGYEKELWNFFEEGKPAIDELLRKLKRESEKEKVLSVYRGHMPDIQLSPEVRHLLEKIKLSGYRLGIITDGRPEGQRNKLEALGLFDIADDIIITDELGGIQFRKPCDIAFRIMATRWRMNPADIIYVGDNPEKDFQAPEQLGMRPVFFDNRERIHLQPETVSAQKIDDIKDLEYMFFSEENE